MLDYHFKLALRHMLQRPLHTVLVAIVVGIGAGATTAMVSLVDAMTADPAPGRSADLYYLRLDAAPPGFGQANDIDTSAASTWTDASNLLRSGRASGLAMMAGLTAYVRTEPDAVPVKLHGRQASAGFFELFGAPFRTGGAWTREDDALQRRVVVLGSELSRHLFGPEDPVGRTLLIGDVMFQVIGQLEPWSPRPLFYESNGQAAWANRDDFFIPISTARGLDMAPGGGMVCWAEGGVDGDACGWLQVWLRLAPGDRRDYEDFLAAYAAQQRGNGRSVRVAGSGLMTLEQRMASMELLPAEVRFESWIALAFLGVCILNGSGLLLARFVARTDEISIRRALGARRRQILAQIGVEAVLTGALGGTIAATTAALALHLIRQRPAAYANLASLDGWVLAASVCLSMAACVAAALVPGWRASGIQPALQLKAR